MKLQAIFITLLTTGLFYNLHAQEAAVFSVELSAAEVQLGNYFEVTFTLENAQGAHFQMPDFSDFNVLAGPNTRSNMTIVNGSVSQTMAYSFYLEPKDLGSFFIPPASIQVGDNVLETPPVEVVVLPNENGDAPARLQEDAPLKESQEKVLPPSEPVKKKKRKIVRL
ncbi:MAG: BatD family protein [Phaeodactylibacter sp.]|nr:BatD family protein [Phaeodactylibacter sp.]